MNTIHVHVHVCRHIINIHIYMYSTCTICMCTCSGHDMLFVATAMTGICRSVKAPIHEATLLPATVACNNVAGNKVASCMGAFRTDTDNAVTLFMCDAQKHSVHQTQGQGA